MRKVFLSFSLLLTLGLTSVAAQDYVGAYSGTLTITPTVYTIGDINNVNTEIENQTLSVTQDRIFFSDIPVYKVGDPVNIGFVNVEFAPNGNFSAPDIDGSEGTVTFSIVSGNISGNTVNAVFRMVDKATSGTLADVTWSYTGTKQLTAISGVAVDKAKAAGYYSIMGQKLNHEPEGGIYIIKYDNGKTEKAIKAK
jgi:hypothetical protein